MRPTRRVFLQSAGVVSLLSGYVAAQDSHDQRSVLAPNGKFWFSVSDVNECRGIPAGSVESWAVDAAGDPLKLISRQSLSLSATQPTHLALSPDGRFIVVPAFGGGIYNVLPVREDGVIGSVTQSVKEIGMSVHPQQQLSSHPHSVAFHPSGKFVIGTDFGSDRINVFEFQDGCLRCLQRMSTPPGSGPAELTISGSGSEVRVKHRLTRGSSSYRFDSEEARLSRI
jgi:6-phosphogluconolactonase (cycloisomerase 2 family)